MAYLHARREKLGGYLPARTDTSEALAPPSAEAFAKFALEANGKEMSTTVAYVRMVGTLLRDKAIGNRLVPIIADEARTFGMADLFRQIGIYSPIGQLYQPEDAAQLSYYKEAVEGQILEEASTRRARSLPGSRRRPAIRRTASRCCRCTSITRCSASSAWAT
jgi:pyruvate dehydrogenase E1 component